MSFDAERIFSIRARICKPFKKPKNRFPAWRNRFLGVYSWAPKMLKNSGSGLASVVRVCVLCSVLIVLIGQNSCKNESTFEGGDKMMTISNDPIAFFIKKPQKPNHPTMK